MPNWNDSSSPQMALPKPGRALMGVMLFLLAVWLMFAVALRWGDANPELFRLFVGNTEAIRSGEVWRLLTAPFLHAPNDPWHLVGVLFGLYFLTPSLEARWGSRRLILFLWMAATLGYCCQFLAELLMPKSVADRLSIGYWFGGVPAIEAVAIAWALSFRGQSVRLFFVLPVSATTLVYYVLGFSVLRLVAVQETAEGLIAPFGGMAAGWLFGAGTPSPARRLLLKLRYRQLQKETERERKQRGSRVQKAPFSVIEGGRKKRGRDDDDDSGGHLLN